MNMTSNRLLLCGLIALAFGWNASAETIMIGGQRVENAEFVSLVPEGLLYLVNEERTILPWEELTEFQRTNVSTKMADDLYNVKTRAIYIEGEVYQRRVDGLVIRIRSTGDSDESTVDYKEGAKMAKNIVFLTGHPRQTDFEDDEPIKVVAYETGEEYEFDMGIAKKMVMSCSYDPPAWAAERDWTNAEGRKMNALLIGVKDGKGLFRVSGNDVVVHLDTLSDEDQAIAAQFVKNSLNIPVY